MDAIANASAAPTSSNKCQQHRDCKRAERGRHRRRRGHVKQMLATPLRGHVRRPEEAFPSQLGVLEHLFLTLRSMALTEDLTNLYNRRGFLRAGTRLLSAASRDKCGALLFYIDVDDLKSINDSAGHAAGDSVLTRAAQILRAVFRDSDLIGRPGGDEFAVLAPHRGR